MIFECIMFNGEVDILKLHLAETGKIVDQFIIVEGTHTFRGKKKPFLSFEKFSEEFEPWIEKTTFLPFTGTDKNPWVNETNQRERMKDGLQDAIDTDFVIISDADEIADPEIVELATELPYSVFNPFVFDAWTYYYYLDTMMEPQDPTSCKGIVMFQAKDVFQRGIQRLREERLSLPSKKAGWHFGWLGGSKKIVEKISSFSHSEFDNDHFKNVAKIEATIKNGGDILDRNFKFNQVQIGYPTHPRYLIDHIQDFKKYISAMPDTGPGGN